MIEDIYTGMVHHESVTTTVDIKPFSRVVASLFMSTQLLI